MARDMEKMRAYGRAYREANREKKAAYGRAYREANKENVAARELAYREANKEKRRAYREANREKKAAYDRAYREANKENVAARELAYREANKEKRRAARLRRKYGLTREQYDSMLIAQSGRCMICGKPFSGVKEPAVDHDHDTGQTRDLLCTRCNARIDVLEDPMFPLYLAYLKRHHYDDP